MKVDVYLSNPRKKILLLKPGIQLTELPEKAQEFASSLEKEGQWEIDANAPRWGLDVTQAIQSLDAKGYYAATATIRIEEV